MRSQEAKLGGCLCSPLMLRWGWVWIRAMLDGRGVVDVVVVVVVVEGTMPAGRGW